MLKRMFYGGMFLFLDILSLPGKFMSKKNNAKWHLKVVCPLCPKFRKKYRDVYNKGYCWWESKWKKKEYDIPKHFGVLNWLKSYFGFHTDLTNFHQIK